MDLSCVVGAQSSFVFPVLRANLPCAYETTELEDVQWLFPVIWVFPGSSIWDLRSGSSQEPPGFLVSRLACVCCESPQAALELVQKWPNQFLSQSLH